jgi:hypothetical protein
MDPSPARVDPLAGIPDDLDKVADRPLEEHAEIFTRVHTALTSALATTAADPAVPSAQRAGGER